MLWTIENKSTPTKIPNQSNEVILLWRMFLPRPDGRCWKTKSLDERALRERERWAVYLQARTGDWDPAAPNNVAQSLQMDD